VKKVETMVDSKAALRVVLLANNLVARKVGSRAGHSAVWMVVHLADNLAVTRVAP
jgi:hypothetical protein